MTTTSHQPRAKTWERMRERGRLESDIRQGKIGVVLVVGISSLSRDDSTLDFVSWLRLWSEHGVKLAVPDRILNPANCNDCLLLILEGGCLSAEQKQLRAGLRGTVPRWVALAPGETLPPPVMILESLSVVSLERKVLTDNLG